MSKKNYFEPEMEVVFVELQSSLLDASPIAPGDDDTPSILDGEGDAGDLG